MSFKFYKFHGAGNDFIIVDNRNHDFRCDVPSVASYCNRRLGIGADGLILLEEPLSDSHFKMRYFNSDGFEASLCGNGSRCITAFAHYLGLFEQDTVFDAFDGRHHAKILEHPDSNSWTVAVEMKPIDTSSIISYADGFFINTGSPHFVRFVDNADNTDVAVLGKMLRHDERFEGGTNVDFVSAHENRLVVRTYERGVENETLSCGTGVTAAALLWAYTHSATINNYCIDIKTMGGNFSLSFVFDNQRFDRITLVGPVVLSYSGICLL